MYLYNWWRVRFRGGASSMSGASVLDNSALPASLKKQGGCVEKPMDVESKPEAGGREEIS